jgi:hypothetical protein
LFFYRRIEANSGLEVKRDSADQTGQWRRAERSAGLPLSKNAGMQSADECRF